MLGERNYTMRAMQHNTNPHLNCSRYNIPSKHLQKTELRVTLPTPVFTSTHGSLEIDPSCKRVLEHRRYMNSLRWMPYAYKRCECKNLFFDFSIHFTSNFLNFLSKESIPQCPQKRSVFVQYHKLCTAIGAEPGRVF